MAQQHVASWMAQGNGIAVPRVAIYEFMRGVAAGSVTPKAEAAWRLFVAGFSIVELDAAGWNEAAQIWGELRKQGQKKQDDGDILVAATAISGGYDVATADDDFKQIKAVRPLLTVHYWR